MIPSYKQYTLQTKRSNVYVDKNYIINLNERFVRYSCRQLCIIQTVSLRVIYALKNTEFKNDSYVVKEMLNKEILEALSVTKTNK